MELLLLSNSTMPSEAFLGWPAPHIGSFLEGRTRVAFVPFATAEAQYDAYADKAGAAFAAMGKQLFSLHREADPLKALEGAEAVAVGGGNTFLLIRALYRTRLIRAIAERVKGGLPFLGWSAGANVACPTIMTTNDMPIVEPPSFRAMHLVPFQINPHYTEAILEGHGGESRDQRIAEYLEAHPQMAVAGLREGSLLRVSGRRMRMEGRGLKLFRHGQEPVEIAGGTDLDPALAGA